MSDKMFEIATRTKVRFAFKGQISVEDLWDLKLEDLDAIYKNLSTQLKAEQTDSLLAKPTKYSETLNAQIEIVKYIVGVKQKEAADRLQEKEKAEKRQKLLEIKRDMENTQLRNKSLEEIDKMLAELDG